MSRPSTQPTKLLGVVVTQGPDNKCRTFELPPMPVEETIHTREEFFHAAGDSIGAVLFLPCGRGVESSTLRRGPERDDRGSNDQTPIRRLG